MESAEPIWQILRNYYLSKKKKKVLIILCFGNEGFTPILDKCSDSSPFVQGSYLGVLCKGCGRRKCS